MFHSKHYTMIQARIQWQPLLGVVMWGFRPRGRGPWIRGGVEDERITGYISALSEVFGCVIPIPAGGWQLGIYRQYHSWKEFRDKHPHIRWQPRLTDRKEPTWRDSCWSRQPKGQCFILLHIMRRFNVQTQHQDNSREAPEAYADGYPSVRQFISRGTVRTRTAHEDQSAGSKQLAAREKLSLNQRMLPGVGLVPGEVSAH